MAACGGSPIRLLSCVPHKPKLKAPLPANLGRQTFNAFAWLAPAVTVLRSGCEVDSKSTWPHEAYLINLPFRRHADTACPPALSFASFVRWADQQLQVQAWVQACHCSAAHFSTPAEACHLCRPSLVMAPQQPSCPGLTSAAGQRRQQSSGAAIEAAQHSQALSR